MTDAVQPPVRQALPLTAPVFKILVALADQERHGYAILQEIARQEDAKPMGTGTLYTAIKRMLAADLIEAFDPPSRSPADDQRRRYYRITTRGRAVAQAEAARLSGLLKLARAKRLVPDGSV